MSVDTVESIVLGVVIGVLVTAFGWLLQFISTELRASKTKAELFRKKRRYAYSRLNSILVGLPHVGDSVTRKRVYSQQLNELEGIVAENHDVLDDSTLDAWYSKTVSSTEFKMEHAEHCIVDFNTFIDNVRWHYERFDKRSPSHQFAYVLNAAE